MNRQQRRKEQRTQAKSGQRIDRLSQRLASRSVAAGRASQSTPGTSAPSPFLEPQADEVSHAYKVAVLESVDGFALLRNALRKIADGTGEWGGIPMPIEGARLVIEPRFPNADKLMAMLDQPKEEDDLSDTRIVNRWWSSRRRGYVVIWEKGGKRDWGLEAHGNSLAMELGVLNAADVWGIEQEHRAIQLLGTLLRHRQLKQYLLTGLFIETSPRSGVTYVFRKLRPTIAFNKETQHILAALCLHPIGYYAGTWAGAMCPTDDVIAHLMLMRGDEHRFWKQANQHRPGRPGSGI